MSRRESFEIGSATLAPGTRRTVDLEVSVLSNDQPMSIRAHVIHGERPGPVFFVSAAVHGDEIIGVEIVRRLAQRPELVDINGTLILVPIVNVFGFLSQSRYLPDRRDLNRSFPGNESGSLAGRLAHLFLTEIVARSNYGVDIHSAAIHRANLPQIRIADLDGPLRPLALAFGAPAIVSSPLREGSLRKAAQDTGADVLLFEAGEGLRFDETAIRAGLSGVLRVMAHLSMITSDGIEPPGARSVISTASTWLRAPRGGLFRLAKDLGDAVEAGEAVGTVGGLLDGGDTPLLAPHDGIVIGRATLPVVNEGDAVLHLAQAQRPDTASDRLETLVAQLDNGTMFYEDEII